MRVEHPYDVPPRSLFEVLVDPQFLAARGERFGATSAATIEQTGQGTVVRTPRMLPLDEVPGPLRKLAGSGELLQVDRWTDVGDEHVRGAWTVDAGSVPVELAGTHDVAPYATGSLYVVTAQAKVRVPVVGKAAEKTLMQHLETLVRKELAFAAEWLAHH